MMTTILAGSKMHVLDWIESPLFADELNKMIAPIGFCVDSQADKQPQSRTNMGESQLVDAAGRFLTVAESQELKTWWLKHQRGAKLPTWDLVVSAMRPPATRALVLVEAKAYAHELSEGEKVPTKRNTPEEQERTNENHEQIKQAILEANTYLSQAVPDINLSADACYQFANRVAWSWKLASLGIPVALVYLGFYGDKNIVRQGGLTKPADWYRAFVDHTADYFPTSHLAHEIPCGAASFWLIVRALKAGHQSPSIQIRRAAKSSPPLPERR